MILEHSQNFISLSYTNVEFLFLNEIVETAFFCNSDDIYEDGKKNKKITHLSQDYTIVDFDQYASSLNQLPGAVNTKNCIVLKTSRIKHGENHIALITSVDCRVKKLLYKDFVVFSDFYNNSFQNKGILACSFHESGKISYLIDIETFLKYLEQ